MSNITIKTDAYNTRYLYVTCEQVQNIAANTSTINWTLTSTGGSSNYYTTGATTLTINGTQAYYMRRVGWDEKIFPAARGSVSGSITVPHSADGKATITVSLSTVIYDAESKIKTYSESWTLDTIPRAATFTGAPAAFNDRQNPTIKYYNAAGSGVTTLQAAISLDGSSADIAYRNINKTSGTYTFSLTTTEWQRLRLATLNGSDSRKVYFLIKTVIGSNTFVEKSAATTFTVINAAPVLAPTAVDTSALAIELTGNANTIIKGYNSVQVAANATAQKGATIQSYSITNGAKSIKTASGKLDYVEEKTFTYKATDNRGLTTTKTVTLSMVNYVKLTCNLSAKIELTGEETSKITLDISGKYFKGSFGAKSNTLTLKYAIKTNSGSYSAYKTISATPTISNSKYSLTYEIPNLDYSNSYTVKVVAYDLIYYGGVLSSEITLRTTPVFDWGENDFNFNVPVSIGGVELDYIVEQGTSDGWMYRKWNSGKGECWKRLNHSTTIDTAWGSWYIGTRTERQTYPMVFSSAPNETVTLLCHGYRAMLMAENSGYGINGGYASACYNVVRPDAVSSAKDFTFNFYVCGNYK